MGRPKIKIIDDSLPKDDLVAKINAELGVKEETKTLETGNEKLDQEVRNLKLEKKPENQASNIKPQNQASSVKRPVSKAKPRSKKYQEASKDLDKSKFYPLTEGIDMVKKMSYSKFNGSLEVHINTVATGVRGLVSLPFASGKKLRILAFPSTSLRASSKDADELQEKGVVFGDDTTIEEINKGKIDFDLLLTTPDWMPKLAKVAKNLGPKGLMPNPKSGTIVSGEDGLKKGVESFQSGKTEYKTENKAPVMHLALGKLDQPTEELSANIKTLIQQIGKTRVKKITLSPTMGPSVKVDISSI